MVATIPDLWPGLKLDTLSPATILRQQVAFIRVKGNGILDAELSTVTGTGDFIIHRLDLIAPILARQKYRVMTATPPTRTTTHRRRRWRIRETSR